MTLSFLVHLSQRLKCTIVITRCLSSVRPSVRPSLIFHIFDFSEETADRNSTKLDRKQDLNVLYQVCVIQAVEKNKVTALASDWLRHFRLLLWNRRTEFNETWQEARSQRPLPSLCFSGRWEKQDGRPGLWLAETFSTSSLKPSNGIQRNLTGSKISTSSTKFVVFRPIGKTRWPPWPLLNRIQLNLTISKIWTFSIKLVSFRTIGKTRWPPWPLIGWAILDFCSETANRNSTKLDTKQDLNVLYQVCVFWTIGKTRWLPGFWLAETFSTSSLKPRKGIQRNLTGSKISMSSTKFVFFMPMNRQKWPPWLICQRGGT